jgi:hypothetical protein
MTYEQKKTLVDYTLPRAIAIGDRHGLRQVLMDILEGDAMDQFVDWINGADDEVVKPVAMELRIIQMPDGGLYLELLPDTDN